MAREVRFGMGKGRVYPAGKAGSLLNPLRRLIQPPGRIVDRLALTPGARVLEIGPGPGYFSIEAAKRIPSGLHCLFDLQAAMLRLAQSRIDQAGVANCRAVQGDALQLPFRDDSFDVSFLVAVLGEVPDPATCLREVRRVLRPGGLLSITEMRGDPDRIRPEHLRALGEGASLTFEGKQGRGWSYTANFRVPAGESS